MSPELVLRPQCDQCGTENELYGSSCRHMTLCLPCGKAMAVARTPCSACAVPVRNLIREYDVRANISQDFSFSIGRFASGLPPFTKKSAEKEWFLRKEGHKKNPLNHGSQDKCKNMPLILEDETGQNRFQGQPEDAQSSNYYWLVSQGKEFIASPAGSWYNFKKIPQHKQLTSEEAEEKMRKRKHNATGYERWMMKAATNGPAAFGEMKMNEGMSSRRSGHPTKGRNNIEGDSSDRNEEEGEEEAASMSKFELNKEYVDDDEEDGKVGDVDFDNDDIEKGDHWEHEEIFTDDDEAVGYDPEEREDLDPEILAPPEIKQDEEDVGEGYEEEGGLSKSGKEFKVLLEKVAGLNESDGHDDGNSDDNMVSEIGMPLVLAPKQKYIPKEEPADSSPVKTTPPEYADSAQGTPSQSKSSKAKREPGRYNSKSAKGAPAKKGRNQNDKKSSSVKVGCSSSSKSSIPSKGSSLSSAKAGPTPSAAPVSEEEIRNFLLAMAPVTTKDLVAKFKTSLESEEGTDSCS